MSATIVEIRARAKHLFRTEQGAEAFLNLPCSALQGVPVELAARGHADEVVAYLVRLEHTAPPRLQRESIPGSRGM